MSAFALGTVSWIEVAWEVDVEPGPVRAAQPDDWDGQDKFAEEAG